MKSTHPMLLLGVAVIALLVSPTLHSNCDAQDKPLTGANRNLPELDRAQIDEIQSLRLQMGNAVRERLTDLIDEDSARELDREFSNELVRLAGEKSRIEKIESRNQDRLVIPKEHKVVSLKLKSNELSDLSVGDSVEILQAKQTGPESFALKTFDETATVFSIRSNDQQPNAVPVVGILVSDRFADKIGNALSAGDKVKIVKRVQGVARQDVQQRDAKNLPGGRSLPGYFPSLPTRSNPAVRVDYPTQRNLTHREVIPAKRFVTPVGQPKVRKDSQAMALRAVARQMEEMAAELEEAGLPIEADRLRDVSRGYWKMSR
ncbi:MAG: hypothetical protein AAFN77_02210 [Planctomycetota bacterium]